jgi:tight adherence protein C
MPELSLSVLKTILLVSTFGAIALGTYTVVRARSLRASIRAGLDEALLSNPSISNSRTAVMSLPFGARVASPAIRSAAGVVYRFGPKGLAEKTRRRLVLAGMSDRVDADTFLAISLLGPLGMLALLATLTSVGNMAPLAWMLVPGSAFLPKLWLTRRVETRQRTIKLALPDTLDLLTIAVESGLGFDAAIARVVAAVPGPLSDELYRMLQEVKIGVPRTSALRSLAERTEVRDLDQFITAMNQADSFGISIANVLRVQAQQLRQKRWQLAEERANKTPVKILFPLILCIFPALFVVIVGPAAIQVADKLLSSAP